VAYTLYRYFDTDHALLYIGISGDYRTRQQTHALHALWFPRVRTIELTHFEDVGAAREAERKAIMTEHPQYNLMHSVVPQSELSEPPEGCGALLTLLEASKRTGIPNQRLISAANDGRLTVYAGKRGRITTDEDLARYIRAFPYRPNRHRAVRAMSVPKSKPENVNQRAWDVLAMRRAGMTLDQIGEHFGVTRERARQIESTALRQLGYL
jgi:hypothetical protein